MWRSIIIAQEMHAEQFAADSRRVLRGVVDARADREEQSATDSRRGFGGGTGETARAVDWKQSATDSRTVCVGVQRLYELLKESNPLRIPEVFCAGVRQESCGTMLLLS